MSDKQIFLSQSEAPTAWYNIQADLPEQLPPPLHPGTKQPLSAADLEPIFARELIAQEMSTERWIDIPNEVLDIYKIWRPSPLVRATGLEKALNTPARIYFKNESVSPPGSHKPNSAVPQAYYNMKQGTMKLITETGAGQWGSSLAFACSFFGMECKVYMVRVSYEQKPYRRSMMHMWGADVTPSPSRETNAGRQILELMPDTPGSLGIAISEAVEVAATNDDANYTLGSVLNHVMLHQSIIGLEAQKQMAIAEDKPDVVIGCVGGGSNFAGLAFPYMKEKIQGSDVKLVAVEPRACPTMTRGTYGYDFGDTTMLTPLIKMFTLGHDFIPPGIHAGGLRYHGMAPLVSHGAKLGLIDVEAYHQIECFDAARVFAKSEGIIPAPESSHAIRGAINEAIRCRETKEEKCILFNLSGHGLCDLSSYDRYFAGDLNDYELPQESIDASMSKLPPIE